MPAVVPPLRLTHRSSGMAPPSPRPGEACALVSLLLAPECAGGAGEWRVPPLTPLPLDDEDPAWEEWAGLGNRLGEPDRWPTPTDGGREGDDDGCCSIRQSASLAAAADARPDSRRPLRLRRPCWLLRSRTRLPRGSVMPGRDPSALPPALLAAPSNSAAPCPRNGGDKPGGPLAEPSSSFSFTEFRRMLSWRRSKCFDDLLWADGGSILPRA